MQTQKTLQASEDSPSTSPIFVEAERLIEQTQKLTQMIAGRAYEFFEGRGRQIGHELEDWFRAEAEVLRPVPIEMKEDENRLTVYAELPGFKATEIKISAEPQRLILIGAFIANPQLEQCIERRDEHVLLKRSEIIWKK